MTHPADSYALDQLRVGLQRIAEARDESSRRVARATLAADVVAMSDAIVARGRYLAGFREVVGPAAFGAAVRALLVGDALAPGAPPPPMALLEALATDAAAAADPLGFLTHELDTRLMPAWWGAHLAALRSASPDQLGASPAYGPVAAALERLATREAQKFVSTLGAAAVTDVVRDALFGRRHRRGGGANPGLIAKLVAHDVAPAAVPRWLGQAIRRALLSLLSEVRRLPPAPPPPKGGDVPGESPDGFIHAVCDVPDALPRRVAHALDDAAARATVLLNLRLGLAAGDERLDLPAQAERSYPSETPDPQRPWHKFQDSIQRWRELAGYLDLHVAAGTNRPRWCHPRGPSEPVVDFHARAWQARYHTFDGWSEYTAPGEIPAANQPGRSSFDQHARRFRTAYQRGVFVGSHLNGGERGAFWAPRHPTLGVDPRDL